MTKILHIILYFQLLFKDHPSSIWEAFKHHYILNITYMIHHWQYGRYSNKYTGKCSLLWGSMCFKERNTDNKGKYIHTYMWHEKGILRKWMIIDLKETGKSEDEDSLNKRGDQGHWRKVSFGEIPNLLSFLLELQFNSLRTYRAQGSSRSQAWRRPWQDILSRSYEQRVSYKMTHNKKMLHCSDWCRPGTKEQSWQAERGLHSRSTNSLHSTHELQGPRWEPGYFSIQHQVVV